MNGKNYQLQRWKFEKNGIFQLNVEKYPPYLYFPLVNEAGMMSSITPKLHGDAKINHDTFLLRPISIEDLHNSNDSRNFWIKTSTGYIWSITRNSARDKIQIFSNQKSIQSELRAGFLWHQIENTCLDLNLKATITNFVPMKENYVELMEIKFENCSSQEIQFTPTAAIPLFGRSADNVRDHRHVTSLLNRIFTKKFGIVLKPTMVFNERGHKLNDLNYAVFGVDDDENPPIGFYPTVEDFIGLNGSLDWPSTIIEDNQKYLTYGCTIAGYEALAGLRFKDISLKPKQTVSYRLALCIFKENDEKNLINLLAKPNFRKAFEDMEHFWLTKHNNLRFFLNDPDYNQWLLWVSIQPVLRKIMGCSFLPYHDYGRGGRGWRDLWQDCLSLMFLEPEQARNIIFKSFAGVRIDGSNATIIGTSLGEFIADRNSIPRVWMDHGAWPLLTTKLYIDQTGDLDLLFNQQVYFKDRFSHRCKQIDHNWHGLNGTKLLQYDRNVYNGTILEHIILENITSFFHVGEHNIILLEGADWNDGMDMASERGESVAFTAFYAYNLSILIELLQHLHTLTHKPKIQVFKEMEIFFDSLKEPINYNSPEEKNRLLKRFFDSTKHNISGEKILIPIPNIIKDLERKLSWIRQHIRSQEWIQSKSGFQWFNGYYDNSGDRIEGDHPLGIRMTLSGQIFTILSRTASEDNILSILKSVDRYLWDPKINGVRMNTNFNEILPNMGRCFGFSYGDKENGAMFSHLAMMFAYALYERRHFKYASKIMQGIYTHCMKFEDCNIYPGIPEYINLKGRGMYPYLTGSASWYILTLITKVFGIKGNFGVLHLDPQLRKDQFDDYCKASLVSTFQNKSIQLTYFNPQLLEPDVYQITQIQLNDQKISFIPSDYGVKLSKEQINLFKPLELNQLNVFLQKKS